MNPRELTEVSNTAPAYKQPTKEVANRLTIEYGRNKSKYDRFAELRSGAKPTGSNIRRVALWVVGSIKTETELVDSMADDLLSGDFSVDKKFLETTTDGEIKWDCYGEWFASNKPDRVADILTDGDVTGAHALLAGRDPETGDPVGKHYLRANKASLVLYLLGYDRVCMDTRIYRALKPAMFKVFKNKEVNHPSTELNNPHRNNQPSQDADKVPVMSHSGDPAYNGEKSYWEDKLKWNPTQYHAMTGHLLDVMAKASEVPRELIPQVAFNTQGETTIHHDLMARIQD